MGCFFDVAAIGFSLNLIFIDLVIFLVTASWEHAFLFLCLCYCCSGEDELPIAPTSPDSAQQQQQPGSSCGGDGNSEGLLRFSSDSVVDALLSLLQQRPTEQQLDLQHQQQQRQQLLQQQQLTLASRCWDSPTTGHAVVEQSLSPADVQRRGNTLHHLSAEGGADTSESPLLLLKQQQLEDPRQQQQLHPGQYDTTDMRGLHLAEQRAVPLLRQMLGDESDSSALPGRTETVQQGAFQPQAVFQLLQQFGNCGTMAQVALALQQQQQETNIKRMAESLGLLDFSDKNCSSGTAGAAGSDISAASLVNQEEKQQQPLVLDREQQLIMMRTSPRRASETAGECRGSGGGRQRRRRDRRKEGRYSVPPALGVDFLNSFVLEAPSLQLHSP